MKKLCKISRPLPLSLFQFSGMILFIAPVLAMLHGCCFFARPPVPWQAPDVKKTGVFREDLLRKASSITSIEIRGRMHVVKNGEQIPSFNVSIWYFNHNGNIRIRMRGSGPMGIAVFDLLADNRQAWIYLPSEGRVITGNTFFTSYGRIDVKTAIKLMEICLNPWSPAGFCKETGCREEQKDTGCLACMFMNHKLHLEYDRDSLMPVSFESSAAVMEFTAQAGTGYPGRISFYMPEDKMSGSLEIKEARFNRLSMESPVFEKALFTRGRDAITEHTSAVLQGS